MKRKIKNSRALLKRREDGQTSQSPARYVLALLLLSLGIFASFCSKKDSDLPVHEPSAQRLYEGSLYYAKAGCHSCHGVAWDGKGSEASTVQKEKGLSPTDFKNMKDPAKTPASYFKAITMGNAALNKKDVNHRLQHYTDRGRWAMANFLFSLAPRLSGAALDKRKAALARSQNEVRQAYARAEKSGLRRWELGYKPAREREPIPNLKDLMKKAGK